MAKGKKKSTAKKTKTKRRRPKTQAPPVEKQLRFQVSGSPEAMKRLEAEAERYYRPWTTQKIVEGRALLDRILAREMFGSSKAQPSAAAGLVTGDLAATEAADTTTIAGGVLVAGDLAAAEAVDAAAITGEAPAVDIRLWYADALIVHPQEKHETVSHYAKRLEQLQLQANVTRRWAFQTFRKRLSER
jgi:hypothetical protein